MPKSRYDETVTALRASPAGQSCADVKALLAALGFEVQDRSKGNHKTYTHAHLADFHGANFDCGHAKTLKAAYVRSIIKVLLKYEVELRAYLGEGTP